MTKLLYRGAGTGEFYLGFPTRDFDTTEPEVVEQLAALRLTDEQAVNRLTSHGVYVLDSAPPSASAATQEPEPPAPVNDEAPATAEGEATHE